VFIEEIVMRIADIDVTVLILDDFGPELVRMGKDIWEIQARALSKAPLVARESVYLSAVRS
jgi:hypothetical protein